MPNIGTSLIAFRLPLAGWLLLIVTALLAAFSVRWGIVHDAALMFYVGREVAAGARSVVDIFDVNMPLVYWIHAGIWLAIGMNELAWRACDAAIMAGICVLGWRLIAPLAGSLTPVAILMIVARHLSYGAELPGQRDVMMLLALLASTVLLVRWVERGRGHFDALGAGILVGVALNIKPVAEGRKEFEVLIKTHAGAPVVKLTDVGFGISQVLPALVEAFYAPPNSMVWMEQPEIHLHPQVQAELADVFISAVQAREEGKPRNVQLIVESHSEHFLTRLQRRVAEGVISPQDVAVYFCKRAHGAADLEPLKLNSYGEIENWPEHFFGDEMADVTARTLAAMRRKISERAGRGV